MKFIVIPGLKGKVFEPDKKDVIEKKHKCPDCYYCQNCGNERCSVCLASGIDKENKICYLNLNKDKT